MYVIILLIIIQIIIIKIVHNVTIIITNIYIHTKNATIHKCIIIIYVININFIRNDKKEKTISFGYMTRILRYNNYICM